MLRRMGIWIAIISLTSTPVWARGGGARGGVGAAGGARGVNVGDRRARNDHLDRVSPVPVPTPTPARPTPAPTPAPAPAITPPAEPTNRNQPVVEHLRHGTVRMIADLARVELSLQIRNIGARTIEWNRAYRVDPAAEVIGAVLHRADVRPIVARTLTLADARRIYEEARTPRRPRNRGGFTRDPLRVERLRRSRLEVTVWPIAPGETVRVTLTFVTPLRGHQGERSYVDVLEGDPGAGWRAGTPRGATPPSDEGVTAAAQWSIEPGELVMAAAPAGMRYAGQEEGTLHFTAGELQPVGARPSVAFTHRTIETPMATVVSGGGVGRRVAIWRMDPEVWLKRHGYVLRPDLTLRVKPSEGGMDRIAPNVFGATDLARPVTARVRGNVGNDLSYVVEVLDRTGEVIDTHHETVHIRRVAMDKELRGAVTGWHRAMLVSRVFDWARMGPLGTERLDQAVAFAVDMGVLVPGTAALAVPPRERNNLSVASRRTYDRDGVPLGAQHREADLKRAPQGALDE